MTFADVGNSSGVSDKPDLVIIPGLFGNVILWEERLAQAPLQAHVGVLGKPHMKSGTFVGSHQQRARPCPLSLLPHEYTQRLHVCSCLQEQLEDLSSLLPEVE